jgi:hypothetical protein
MLAAVAGIALMKACESLSAWAFCTSDLEEALPYLVPEGFLPLGFDQKGLNLRID